ncbi:hypothetical protein ACFV4F_41970 [Kitasatospora sp. NPDC059722]|uniref:hypothetical protein n=1 Tax=Kitasatospora sp. NPDC059722 TaxID=3346925 RepID=UPI003680EE3D
MTTGQSNSTVAQPPWWRLLSRLHHQTVERRIASAQQAANVFGTQIDESALRKALTKRPHWFADLAFVIVLGGLGWKFISWTNANYCATPGVDPSGCASAARVTAMQIFLLIIVSLAAVGAVLTDNLRVRRINKSAVVLVYAVRVLELCSRVAGGEHPAYSDTAELVGKVGRLRESLIYSAARAASDLTVNTKADREVRNRAAQVSNHLGCIADSVAGDPVSAAKDIGGSVALIIDSVTRGKWDDLLQGKPLATGSHEQPRKGPRQKRPVTADVVEGRSLAVAFVASLLLVVVIYGGLNVINSVPITPSLFLSAPMLLIFTFMLLAYRHGLMAARRIVGVVLSVRRSIRSSTGETETEPDAKAEEPPVAA